MSTHLINLGNYLGTLGHQESSYFQLRDSWLVTLDFGIRKFRILVKEYNLSVNSVIVEHVVPP